MPSTELNKPSCAKSLKRFVMHSMFPQYPDIEALEEGRGGGGSLGTAFVLSSRVTLTSLPPKTQIDISVHAGELGSSLFSPEHICKDNMGTHV